ncbi:MAG TPA: O-antigen ligase family protein [Planctomycetota bacterium]|jgi:O-antigen ligase
MIYTLFVLFVANLVLRLNDFWPTLQNAPIAEIVVPILVLLWLLFERKEFSLATDLFIPAYFIAMVAGYALVVWPEQALIIGRAYLPWAALYFLAANLVRTSRRLDILFAVLLAMTLLLVVHAVQQVAAYDGINDDSGIGWSGEQMIFGRPRYVGILNDPNDLALFFVMMLPLAMQFASSGRSTVSRLAGYLCSVPILLGIYLTNSRGGMLAAGGIAAIFAYRRWGISRAALVIGTLAMVALAYGPSRVREESASDTASTEGRINAWAAGLQMFKQHPVLGVGMHQFTQYHEITAHNSFVICFAENGLAGYVPWLGAGFFALYGLHSTLRRLRQGTRAHRQTLALFDSLVGFYIGGFFLSRDVFILLPVLIGLAAARVRATRDELADADADAEAVETPVEIVEESPVDEQHSAPEPLPDISWRAGIRWLPKLTGMAVLSILVIHFIVLLKR